MTEPMTMFAPAQHARITLVGTSDETEEIHDF